MDLEVQGRKKRIGWFLLGRTTAEQEVACSISQNSDGKQ
jgi:hypothetical protein